MNETLKKQIIYTLQLLMSVYVALEIAIPPNPHIKHIIIIATIVVVLKHNIVENILDVYERLIKKLFK